jgi:hypothetical protein
MIMASELVKVSRHDLALPAKSDARRVMDEALARLRPSVEIEKRQSQSIIIRPSRMNAVDVIDLPRLCSVHDRFYVARYVRGSGGRFGHAQTFRMTEALRDQYESGAKSPDTMASANCAEEACAWCGAHGLGAVRCGTCRVEVCYGRTVGKYFQCTKRCGGKGKMKSSQREQKGICPSLSDPFSPSS